MKSIKVFALVMLELFFNGFSANAGSPEYSEPNFGIESAVNINVLNSSVLFDIGTLRVVDTLIIYSGMTDASDKVFHVFSRNTGKYLTSFGNIGRAQNEVSQPGMGFTIDKERKVLYVFDNIQRKMVSFSIEKIITGVNENAKEIKLPSCVANVSSLRFLYMKDSFLAGYTYNDRFLACGENDSITSSNIYPELDEPTKYKNVEESYFLFAGCMAAKPDGCKFVHSTTSGCLMEIWDFDGKNLKQETVKRFIKPDYDVRYRDMPYPQVMPKSNAPKGIISMACSNQYIYANYDNVTNKESKHKIAVFDWKGNPKKIYSIGRQIYTFDVVDNSQIYALAANDADEIELVRISLK